MGAPHAGPASEPLLVALVPDVPVLNPPPVLVLSPPVLPVVVAVPDPGPVPALVPPVVLEAPDPKTPLLPLVRAPEVPVLDADAPPSAFPVLPACDEHAPNSASPRPPTTKRTTRDAFDDDKAILQAEPALLKRVYVSDVREGSSRLS
jgi:hypothetical protein